MSYPLKRSGLFSVFRFTDQLSHRPHRAIDTPAARLEKDHSNQAQHGGGQHDAVKAEGKLCHTVVKDRSVVGPVPGQLKGPQQRDRLLEVLHSGEHEPGTPEH